MFWAFGPEQPDEYGNSLEDRQNLWEKNQTVYNELYRPFVFEKQN